MADKPAHQDAPQPTQAQWAQKQSDPVMKELVKAHIPAVVPGTKGK